MLLVPGRGKDVIIDLLNDAVEFPRALTSDDVYISPPKAVSGPNPTMVEVKVIGLPNGPWEGALPVRYQRMDLTSAFGDLRPRVEGPSNGSLHALLPMLSEKLGIQLYPEDIVETDYSYIDPDEEVNLQLKAAPESLSYVGEGVITFTRRRYLLSVVIKVPTLDVVRFPGDSNTGREQVNMRTYSTDFTPYYSSIRRHPNYNLPANPNGQVNLMRTLFGWSNWPYGWAWPLLDYATTERPESNQDYDRVLIQSLAGSESGRTYEGTAYFHYNVVTG